MYNMTNTKDINNIKQLILWKIKGLLIIRKRMVINYQNHREGYPLNIIKECDKDIYTLVKKYDEILASAAALTF